ncbi:acyltransferase [Sphaerotilus montanus]|jgi:galactoside O-acetyltransferase|uniref:Galactoside O-acetyltransferase n=1 Tax=Sphaerotilus montanus TaxID=522889 RepID=A0A7Y9QZ15_9BURK|nr:acyltransferase [Sphaerotilus montanus]NYG31862.1 galactoside O-acetyltransferase [Sphaerotilus montanus]NZD57330.1 acyltransferase [Sphaerotilus montanus]
MAWLTSEKIASMGFAEVGKEVYLSDKASFHNCAAIRLGTRVRIDDFCILSAGAGGIYIGSHVHVAVFSSLIGAGEIRLDDFSNISSRVAIYSSTDDFTGEAMTNPMVPARFTNVTSAPVHIGRHVVIGTGSVVLPGCVLAEGVAVGALSMVNRSCEAFGIYAGVPARLKRPRSNHLLELEQRFASDIGAR